MSLQENQSSFLAYQSDWGKKSDRHEFEQASLDMLGVIEQATGRILYDHAATLVDITYDALEGCEDLMHYHLEHGTPSLQILTQYNPRVAAETAQQIAAEIKGKRVIEIGAGVGFLAIEMAKLAKSVFAIEVDPAWSWVFTHSLYRLKPPNLTWIFGSTETVVDWLNGDMVVIATRSGIDEMRALGYRMAPKVIMLGLE